MTYQNEVHINLPRERVIELFSDSENLPKWQPTLQSYEALDDKPGEVGGKTRFLYQMGKRTREIIETIEENQLPDTFVCIYEGPAVINRMHNQFEVLSPHETRWVTHNSFQFRGMMKLIGWLFQGAFPKQTQKDLEAFKAFAEQA